MIPRLIDFSEKVDKISSYHNIIDDMKSKALKSNGYWNFDKNIITEHEAAQLCNSENDIVVSNKWRLIGIFGDIVMLAKLIGYFYQSSNREISLPNFNPEETYWIKSLELAKLSPSLIENKNEIITNLPLITKSKSFWETNSSKLCACCPNKQIKKSFFNTIEIIPTTLPGTLSPVANSRS
jgi:hypothetical protein